MRVLLLEDSKTNALAVVEITFIGFDDDITGVKDEDGDYDRYEATPVTGIYMVDAEGDSLYIEGVSHSTCNNICREFGKGLCRLESVRRVLL